MHHSVFKILFNFLLVLTLILHFTLHILLEKKPSIMTRPLDGLQLSAKRGRERKD